MSTPSSLKINLPPTFANSFWSSPDYRVGVEALYSRLQSGLDENASIIALVEHRAALEYSHAEQLATPCPLPTYSSPLFKNALREGPSKSARSFAASNSSASHAFRAVESESIQVQAAAHGKVARNLEKNILIPFGKWKEDHQGKVQNSWEFVDANLQRFEKQKAEVDRLRAQYETKCRQADEAEDDARFAGGELTSPPASSDSDTMQEKQRESISESSTSNTKDPKFDAEPRQDDEKAPLDPDRLKRRETLRQQFGFRRASAAADDEKYTSMTPRSVSAEETSSKEAQGGVKRSSTLSSALSSALHKASEVPALQNLRAVVGGLNEPRHLRLRKEAETAEVNYRDAVRSLDKLRCELEEILSEHFTLTEKWEASRLIAIKRVLAAFHAAFVTLLPSLSASLQRSSALDSSLDVDQSLTHLIVDGRTGPYQPQPQVFIPYYHDDPSSLSGSGTAGFGMDLSAFMRAETLASESGIASGEIRAGAGESYKVGMPAIPLALMALLASLERMYDDSSRWPAPKEQSESSPARINAEKRKAWIYEVPLTNIHMCREAIITHLLGNSVPGADVGAGLETKLKRFDPPTLAATVKVWAMELSDSLINSTLWDAVDNTYRAAAGQEYDSRATPSKTVGEVAQEKSEGEASSDSSVKGKGRAEGLDPVLEETIRKGVLADLSVILSRLPKIHLVCLDAIIGHLARLIKATPVEESEAVFLNKVALALGRVIIRPQVETASTLRSRAPVLLAHDLIKYYDDLLPSLLAKKAKESEAALLSQRKTPIRKRTKPIDQRMSRSRMAASSSDTPLPAIKDEPASLQTPTKLQTHLPPRDEDDDDSVTPIGSRILGNTLPTPKKDEDPSRVKSPASNSSSAYDTPDETDEKTSTKSTSPSITATAATTASSNTTYDDDIKLSNVARLSRQFGSSGSVKSMVRGPRAAGGSK